MKRIILSGLLLGTFIGVTPALAADAALTACTALSEADAVKLLGGPLGEVAKREVKPTAENGYDNNTSCGYFPKGYSLEEAEGPPERGLIVQFHTMRNKDDAKHFYEGVLDLHKQMHEAPGSPSAGTRITTVSGMGEGAHLNPVTIPNSRSKIVTITFLKGNLVGSVQVFNNAAPVDDIARAAAKQILAKMP